MDWSAEEVILMLTGMLFTGAVLASLHPRVALTTSTRIALSGGAVAYFGIASVLGSIDPVVYPPLMWVVPVLPMLAIVILVKDAVAGSLSPQRANAAPDAIPARSSHVTTPYGARAAASEGNGSTSPYDADRGADSHDVELLASSPLTPGPLLADLAYTFPGARPAVAANPATPANVLTWLAALRDPAVHVAIAQRGRALPASR